MTTAPCQFALIAAFALAVVACSGVSNLHQVDGKVWRSAQPTSGGFDAIKEEHQVQRVLNLRSHHSDKRLAPDWERHHLRLSASTIDDEDVLAALRILTNSDEATLVHCLHGSDRTGVVIAAYRMVVQGWPRERAIAEFTDPQYGHHDSWFPNLEIYLENLDVEAMRRKLAEIPSAGVNPGVGDEEL